MIGQALVPLKDLVLAKTRLAGVLSASERRKLAQAMVEDVLSVLSTHAHIERVTLLSDDPGAALLAREYGADHWAESEAGGRGLNQLVERASARLLAAAPEHSLIVLHGDLPLLGEADITAVLALRQEHGGLVIGTDTVGTGTNLLAFDRHCVPRFCFGHDSCRQHRRWAEDAGVPVRVLSRSGVALDIDEAQDLTMLLTQLDTVRDSRTRMLLGDSILDARLQLALAESIDQQGWTTGESQ